MAIRPLSEPATSPVIIGGRPIDIPAVSSEMFMPTPGTTTSTPSRDAIRPATETSTGLLFGIEPPPPQTVTAPLS